MGGPRELGNGAEFLLGFLIIGTGLDGGGLPSRWRVS